MASASGTEQFRYGISSVSSTERFGTYKFGIYPRAGIVAMGAEMRQGGGGGWGGGGAVADGQGRGGSPGGVAGDASSTDIDGDDAADDTDVVDAADAEEVREEKDMGTDTESGDAEFKPDAA